MRILVVDNGGQWTHREWRVLKYLGVETAIVPNTTEPEKIEADGVVLSGGAPRVGSEALKLGNSSAYLDTLDIPILGICVGAQFTALHFGGSAGPADVPEYGKTLVKVDEPGELFNGLPPAFQAWESHNDEISALPETLVKLAHSDNCRVQAFAHRDRPIFGVQFHPEVEHTEHGYDIFKNFIRVCGK